jgi:cytoskeletal protein CcmA (bactofilin family)
MFNRQKQPSIKSLIAQDCQIDGNFSFVDGLRLDGTVLGNITGCEDHPSILVISEFAVVRGEIHADHVIVNGRVEGPVYARTMLELQPKGRITGDVTYKVLEMHRGAIVEGRLSSIMPSKVAIGEVQEKPTLKLAANNQ